MKKNQEGLHNFLETENLIGCIQIYYEY